MIVQDIANQTSDVFEKWYDWKDTILEFVSPDSVQTLITRGEMINTIR